MAIEHRIGAVRTDILPYDGFLIGNDRIKYGVISLIFPFVVCITASALSEVISVVNQCSRLKRAYGRFSPFLESRPGPRRLFSSAAPTCFSPRAPVLLFSLGSTMMF